MSEAPSLVTGTHSDLFASKEVQKAKRFPFDDIAVIARRRGLPSDTDALQQTVTKCSRVYPPGEPSPTRQER
jgi:hypothetical protein